MKKYLKWILLGLLLAGVVAVFVNLWKKSRPKQAQYEQVEVTIGDIRRTTIVTGSIEPRNEVEIKPQINGTIAELYVEAGNVVKAGDPIAKIRVVTDAQSLSSAESQLKYAEFNMENQREIFRRDSALYADRIISTEEYQRSRLQLITYQEQLKAAQNNLSLVRDGVTATSKDMTNTIVRATISGMILDVAVKVGNSVQALGGFSAGTTVATMADMRDLLFVGKIDETEVGRLHVGMPMDLIVGAMNDQRFSAQLEYIAPKGTSVNGAMMFEIKGAATIPDSVIIRSGYSANAEIILEEKHDVLTLSEECISMRNGKPAVCLLRDTASTAVDTVEVQTGLSDGLKIEIISGLKEGDIVRGNEILPQLGANVEIRM